jgi:hypothetical protein
LTGPIYVGDGISERELDRSYIGDDEKDSVQVANFWYSVRLVEPGQ